MPIEVYWGNDEKTVMRFVFQKPWTWDDFYRAVDRHFVMLRGVDHLVYAITDVSQAGTIPPSALSHGRYYWKHWPPNLATIIIIGANPLFLAMDNLFHRLYGDGHSHLRYANSVEEALSIINSSRALLRHAS